MSRHLHLSIGPVQAFVSQSRRTRDLWGSSFLLSFLAAHAMSGARGPSRSRKIVRPLIDDGDPMLQWVEGRNNATPPRFGSIPNQFTVDLPPGTDAQVVAEEAIRHLRKAWRKVCDAVWEEYLPAAVVNKGQGTKAIWDRQTDGFWEIDWVAGDPDDRGILAQRKYWRTHWLPEEAGNKCTVMPDLQELSGHVRSASRGAREAQDEFWRQIRTRLSNERDLEEDERLSAIAFIKRFYPHVSEQALDGYVDVKHWPSTVDVAAVPWCEQVLRADADKAEAFANAVKACDARSTTGGVSDLLAPSYASYAQAAPTFARLDANWFHRSYVKRELGQKPQAATRCLDLLRGLEELKTVAGRRLGGPSIYFALLLADGDRLGATVGALGSDVVSNALAAFTRKAPDIVRQSRGVVVYAGGDDVLALLPIDDALRCARALDREYREAFDEAAARARRQDHHATLSAAVVFAHARAALSLVIAEAHRLLDVVAKDGNNRNSLAAGVYRRSGTAAEWVTTWTRLQADGTPVDAVEQVLKAVTEIEDGKLSGSLLHDLHDDLGRLTGLASPEAGRFATLVPDLDLVAFLRADIYHRLEGEDRVRKSKADQLAALLGGLLRRSRNQATNTAEAASPFIGLDGLALARFLADGGREEGHVA